MTAGERDPQWIGAAVRAVGHEWAEYARAAWAVTTEPARFARQWADGEREALNPFACLANALAFVTLFEVLLRLLAHAGGELPPWLDLLRPAIQLFNSAVTVSLFHFPLVLLGGRRPWRTSLGVALFVTAGPMVPLSCARALLAPIDLAAKVPHLSGLAIGFAVALSLTLVAYLVVALAAAQHVARWRAGVAFLLGSSVLAAILLLLKMTTGAR